MCDSIDASKRLAVASVEGRDQQHAVLPHVETHLGQSMNDRSEYHTGLLLMTSLLGIWPLHPFNVLEGHSACFSRTMALFTDMMPIAYFELIFQFSRFYS